MSYVSDILFPKLVGQLINRNRSDTTIQEEDAVNAFPDILKRMEPPAASRKARGKQPAGHRYQKLPLSDFEQLPPPYPMEERELKALGKLVDPAILLINTDQACGTAFLIHPQGYAVTCHHVVDGARFVRAQAIIFAGDREFACTVVNSKPEYDLAVIKLDSSDADKPFPYLPMAKRGSITEKDDRIEYLYEDYEFGIFSIRVGDEGMDLTASNQTEYEPLSASYTHYAAQKHVVSLPTYMWESEDIEDSTGDISCNWWLRSKGDQEYAALMISGDGFAASCPAAASLGVRPMISIGIDG